MNPIPNFKLSRESVDDKDLLVVEIMTGNETPYYYSGEGQLLAFVRLGNESVPANPAQLRELVIKGSGRSYDSLPHIRKSLWKEMFWSQSYCLITTGGATVDVIKQYIQSQGAKDHGE